MLPVAVRFLGPELAGTIPFGRFNRTDDLTQRSPFFDRALSQSVTPAIDREELKRVRIFDKSNSHPTVFFEAERFASPPQVTPWCP